KKLTDLQIDPQAVDPDDVDMLADLVLAAVNDGLEKVDAATQQKFGKYAKGLNI
ncbi:YbaB/EbfC family nucleoid-associated protein, partial [Limosilactobacillus mucosae]|nr:YbaB/EbfC family nucleoid-associated protein [Limosilactobacillus mucosae]